MSFDSYDGELPLSLDQLRDQWNAQADDFNQWDSLGLDEQIGWAQARAAELLSQRRPLWEVIEGCGMFGQIPVLLRRQLSAVLICAVRDWLAPESPSPSEHLFDGDCNPQWDRWKERQRLRALLTAEADRAERGDHD